MTPFLCASARLLAISTLLPPAWLAMEGGALGHATFLLGFLCAALAGAWKHGLGKPLVGFETFLIGGLGLSALVSTAAWALIDRQPEIALRDGQLCGDVGAQIAPAAIALVAGIVLSMGLAGAGVWQARHGLRADRKDKPEPPMNVWIFLGLTLYIAAATAVCIATYNRTACSIEFIPLGLILPMLITFSAMLGAGYCVAAVAIRTRPGMRVHGVL